MIQSYHIKLIEYFKMNYTLTENDISKLFRKLRYGVIIIMWAKVCKRYQYMHVYMSTQSFIFQGKYF